jgi:hypothetical protein
VNERREKRFILFRRFLYNNADKTGKWAIPEYNTMKGKREREMEVKSIMDGSEKKREHHQRLFVFSLLML